MKIAEALPPMPIAGQDQIGIPGMPSVSFAELVADHAADDQGEPTLSMAFAFEELGVFGLAHSMESDRKIELNKTANMQEGTSKVLTGPPRGLPDHHLLPDVKTVSAGALTFGGSAMSDAAASPATHRRGASSSLFDAASSISGELQGNPEHLTAEGEDNPNCATSAGRKRSSDSEPQPNLTVYRSDSGLSLTIGGSGLSPAAQAELLRRLQSIALSLGFAINDIVVDGLALGRLPAEHQSERNSQWPSIR